MDVIISSTWHSANYPEVQGEKHALQVDPFDYNIIVLPSKQLYNFVQGYSSGLYGQQTSRRRLLSANLQIQRSALGIYTLTSVFVPRTQIVVQYGGRALNFQNTGRGL